MAKITFNSEGISFRLKDVTLYKSWIVSVAAEYGRSVDEISIVFVSDAYLLEMNRNYLSHDYYTDIITFDYSEGSKISGDLFISLDRIKENALKLGVSLQNEIQRVVIHGVLHLCGLKDKGKSDAQNMRKSEEIALQKFPSKSKK